MVFISQSKMVLKQLKQPFQQLSWLLFLLLLQQPVLSVITEILAVNYVITEHQKSFKANEYSKR